MLLDADARAAHARAAPDANALAGMQGSRLRHRNELDSRSGR